MTEKRIVEAVKFWLNNNVHNPSWRFVRGNRAFTPEELLEHIEKGTPEGQEILGMIEDTAVDLFMKRRLK